MLSFCGFMILVMIGFLFVKKENKKKLINLIQDNIGLVGAALVLLFLVRGVSGFKVEGYGEIDEDEPVSSQCGSP
jgi:hypothetical protein